MKLMGQQAHASARLRGLAVAFGVAVCAAVLAAVLGAGSAGAAPRVAVLGAAAPATPSCPTTCQAVGKTTGFQTSITGARNPFVATFRGRIVAWSIKTGAPSTKPNPNNNNVGDYDFLTRTFGGPPRARISVLKPIMKKVKRGKPIYKLKSQSPVEDLAQYLGQTTTFTLAGTPQEAQGSQRAYGCTYNTARLLYSATVVADPNQKPAAPPKKPKQ